MLPTCRRSAALDYSVKPTSNGCRHSQAGLSPTRPYAPAVPNFAGCARLPVVVSRCEWISKPVRTGGPSGPVHQEWRLEIGLKCDAEPIRLAAMLIDRHAGELHHVRPSPDAVMEATYRLDFFPYDWNDDDGVQVNAMGSRVAVHSRELTREPNLSVRPLVEVGATFTTGVVSDLVDLASTGWVAQVALFAQSDTKKDRTRWHVRTGQGDDAGVYGFLWSGLRSGSVSLLSD
jgi:hypothetical protein